MEKGLKMFNTIIDKYMSSSKTKEDKIEYLHGLHKGIMIFKQLNRLINAENSVINSFEITKNGAFIVLDETRGNTKIFFDENDCEEASVEIMCSLDYERKETETMLSIVNEIISDSFVMLDIGTNVGWYSLLIKSLYKNADVYSFEPAPFTYERLINNLKLNNQPIDKAFNIGLYDKRSKMDFYYDIEGSGGSSMANLRGREKVEKIQVDVEPLDEFAIEHSINKVDFIKCDVEGSELFVFKGGINLIEKTKPVIFSEMLRKWSAKFNYTPNDIIKLLGEIGYECFAICGEKQLRFCPVVDENTIETNYYFLHRDKHKEIIEKFNK